MIHSAIMSIADFQSQGPPDRSHSIDMDRCVSETEIRKLCPWETDAFLVPPKGHDKWIVSEDSQWCIRAHGTQRKRGFLPGHRSFPLKDTSRLTGQRISIVFQTSKLTSQPERFIFVDQYTDMTSEVMNLNYNWKGYTFFKVCDGSSTSPSASVLPNDIPLGRTVESPELATSASDNDTCSFEIVR